MAFFSSSWALDQIAQHGALLVILAVGRDEALRHGRCCRGADGDFDAFRVLQEAVGELLDFRRHGCREEQRLAGERDQLGDALDIGNETHVEHAVGFVDDEDFDAGHQKLAALAMVEQAAGRADQHIGAALELAVLFVEGDAADQKGDVELVVLAVFFEVLGDLGCEFARRLKDQRARHARPGAALFQQRQHRQHEGCRLAGSRLGDAENIAPLQGRRNGASLDRCRDRVARVGNCGKNFLAQAKV